MAGTALTRQVCNLPADLTSFVGRKRELAEIKRLLSVSRLVTLTGVGGVGKTRLALRAATDQRRAFDAVWLIDFTSLTDPALVVQTVAATMGLRDDPSASPLEVLSKVVASNHTLLVLDNCEHLLQACASLADHLLRVAPELQILATSRQSLGIMAEHQVNVAPLPVPEPDERLTPGALKLYDAVTLLVERAIAVVPDFSVTSRNQSDVVRLCRHLDGIPLAIELAAVRLRALSVDQLAERLAERYRWLTGGNRTAVPRQQTLRALIDWSYRLLSPAEQRLWARISIFPGHFDLDAAEAVCAGEGIEREEVLDLLDALLDKSLLLREVHGGLVRYRMLETIREFGRLHLSGPEERRALQRRHRDWYRGLVDRAAAEWFGPDQVAWFTRLRLENAHLRAAMDFCLREPGEAEIGLRMATDLLRPHWLAGAYYSEAQHWLARLLEAAPQPTATRAAALCAEALMAFDQADFAAGRPLVDEARVLAEKLGDRPNMAMAATVSGLAALYMGDDPRAAALLEEAVAGHTATGDGFGVALSTLALAVTISYMGDAPRAHELFKRSLTLTERHGETLCRAWTLTAFATHMWLYGDNERATVLARESLVVGRLLQDPMNIVLTMETMGYVLTDQGQYERAARMFGAAEAVGGSAGVTPFLFERFIGFHDRYAATLKDKLGDRAFAQAMEQGRTLTVEGAVTEALGARPGEPGAQPDRAVQATTTAHSPLTAREREVAELVAQGLSNKQIAAALVIAPRTAEGHVEHIMTKLGFNSRAKIAAWMTAEKTSLRDDS
ncbi:ATP-binding protein [Nonomuraea lactucae]|uniref:ATP-binding protein n=1 Tax=Nonomuraea lactucae TaxID=2249762 RepID=UPI001964B1BB|nr:LuxR C-terminal-related transcriptional regulator [Nonomuraea lactucae]